MNEPTPKSVEKAREGEKCPKNEAEECPKCKSAISARFPHKTFTCGSSIYIETLYESSNCLRLTAQNAEIERLKERITELTKYHVDCATDHQRTLTLIGQKVSTLESQLAKARELDNWLRWALEMMEMYEWRLIKLGDDKKKVYSETHVNALKLAYAAASLTFLASEKDAR